MKRNQDSQIAPDRVPLWLTHRALALVPPIEPGDTVFPFEVIKAVAIGQYPTGSEDHSISWLDHVRVLPPNDGEAFVAEPYRVTPRDLKSIERFCTLLRLDYSIDGNSVHNPGRTIRLTFLPKKRGRR